MPVYHAVLNVNGLHAGRDYDIPDAEVEQWAGEIELGFLVEVHDENVTPWVPGATGDKIAERFEELEAQPIEDDGSPADQEQFLVDVPAESDATE